MCHLTGLLVRNGHNVIARACLLMLPDWAAGSENCRLPVPTACQAPAPHLREALSNAAASPSSRLRPRRFPLGRGISSSSVSSSGLGSRRLCTRCRAAQMHALTCGLQARHQPLMYATGSFLRLSTMQHHQRCWPHAVRTSACSRVIMVQWHCQVVALLLANFQTQPEDPCNSRPKDKHHRSGPSRCR